MCSVLAHAWSNAMWVWRAGVLGCWGVRLLRSWGVEDNRQIDKSEGVRVLGFWGSRQNKREEEDSLFPG